MFADIEVDEAEEGAHRVERVQVEPLVLERSPPRLDHRVREGDLRLCQDSVEDAGVDEFIDRCRSVLYASVGEHGRRLVRLDGRLAGFNENLQGVCGIKVFRDSPGENPSGEVVDDGVEISAAAIEESHDARVDVPNLIGCCGADTESWLSRVHTLTGSSPTMSSDESMPGGGRSEDLSEALRQNGERTGRYVAVLLRMHHFLERLTLLSGELLRARLGA